MAAGPKSSGAEKRSIRSILAVKVESSDVQGILATAAGATSAEARTHSTLDILTAVETEISSSTQYTRDTSSGSIQATDNIGV